MNTRTVLCLAMGLISASAFAQDPPSHQIIARFKDGKTIIDATIVEASVKIHTKYGELCVPFSDIRRITFGFHYPKGAEREIEKSIHMLSSLMYKEREEATQRLIKMGHVAYPMLKNISGNQNDLEVVHRVQDVIRKIEEKTPKELLSAAEKDNIQTNEFAIKGKIVGSEFKARSQHFGNIDLAFHQIAQIFGGIDSQGKELNIDAKQDSWVDAQVNVDENTRLTITATGQVDLWPQGPGQYMTTPKGYTTAGKGSAFMAGAVVGRLGENGQPFLIGERYEGTPPGKGRLFVHIVPAPWNNASSGSYRAVIKTEYTSGR
jgi:hypothetical protein